MRGVRRKGEEKQHKRQEYESGRRLVGCRDIFSIIATQTHLYGCRHLYMM